MTSNFRTAQPFTKGESYLYSMLETFATQNDLILEEYGKNVLGSSFLSTEKDDRLFSFVLTGTIGNDYIYECIYAE